MRFFLQICYNGAAYHGWQLQKNAIGIQQVMNEKLSIQLGAEIYCIGCGRTDAGVHAKRFFLHFDYENLLPDGFLFKLNSFLPRDIFAAKVFNTPDDSAHSRWSAIERTYKYMATIGRNPLMLGYAGAFYRQPDVEAMNKAATALLRHTDHKALSKRSPEEEHHLCSITKAEWKQKNDMLIFTITANRFLRGMVRIVVGTLWEVGKGKITPEEFEDIILRKDRSRAFGAAPAEGLYLWDVKYPEGLLLPV